MLKRMVARILNLVTGRRADERLREEMESHIAMQTEEYIRAGLSPEEARRQARLKFGTAEAVREQYHAEEGLPLAENVLQDTRFALRQLSKSPGFTFIAVLTLALGIGANTAIFSLVNAVLLSRLPVSNPGTLIRLGDQNDCCIGYGVHDNGDYSVFSTTAWEQLRKNAPEFEELAAMQSGFESQPIIVRHGGSQTSAHSAIGEFVSGNYFSMLGLSPAMGRLFSDADDNEGASPTAVMSYEAWKDSYAADRAVVGSTLYVNSRPVTVIGVAPKGFFGDRLSSTPPDLYLPIASAPALANASYVHDPAANWLYLIGRVKPGVSLPQLQTKLSALLRQILAPIRTFSSEPDRSRLSKVHVVLTSGGAGIRSMDEQYSLELHLLIVISALVLLIACANVANLLLVRGMGRRAELSVRTALGATHSRLVRQLLTESLVVALLGGLTGIAVAYGGTRILLALAFPDARALPIQASPSPMVLIFAIALSVATGILFGVAPALMAARTEPIDALRTGSRSVAGGATLLQRGLVVTQTALSLVLLVTAGLFIQSLNHLQEVNLNLDASNRYIIHIDPQAAGYLPSQLGSLYQSIEQRFDAIPGVAHVGISTFTPMELWNDSWTVQIQGHPGLQANASDVKINPDYFASVGTRLLFGRGIGPQDTPTSTTVAVVNQAFVRKFFKPGEDPIGHHFGTGPRHVADYEIVGVVENTVYTTVQHKDHPMYFLSLLQRPVTDKGPIDEDYDLYARTIVLETDHPIPSLESLTRQTLASINPNLAVVKFETFDGQIADQFGDNRTIAELTTFFGALALLLAMTGLYGVTAFSVSRRTNEIGIRMALGADRGSVIAMVLRGAFWQVGVGLGVGIPAAIGSAYLMANQLFGVVPWNPLLLAGATLLLALAAFVATVIPAQRAASITPTWALRSE
ncbi:MAG TPA: ABC transporter permease [Terracidiphilus sp.]|jgi:predicted permease|nr:ABC transporter permease [Terracidiphilus sp.]